MATQDLRFKAHAKKSKSFYLTELQFEVVSEMMKGRSEQLYEIDQLLFDQQSDQSLQSLYKQKKTKRSPTKSKGADFESTESPSPINKKGRLGNRQVNPRAFLSGVFPGDDDPKTFDKMDRIQKLMIVDTTTDVVQAWGMGHFLKSSQQSILRTSIESVDSNGTQFAPFFMSVVVSTAQHELFAYQIRIKPDMPMFQYLPGSREILHRLCLKATLTKSVDELKPSFERLSFNRRTREEQPKMMAE